MPPLPCIGSLRRECTGTHCAHRCKLWTGAPHGDMGKAHVHACSLTAALRVPLHAPHAGQGRRSGPRGSAARLVRGGRGPRLRQAALRGRQGTLRGRAGVRRRRVHARRLSLLLRELPRRLLRRHARIQSWLAYARMQHIQ